MAIVMQLRWTGVTQDQYDEVRDIVGWETDTPTGGIFHVAWFEGDGLHVTDVWESAEDFPTFVDGRLMPGVAKVGIDGQPEVSVQPAHRIFDGATGQTRS